MKYHFFIKKYETVCHTHNCRACLQSLCYRRWEVTPTTQHPVAWKLNWAPPHGRQAREGFRPQEAKLWPVHTFSQQLLFVETLALVYQMPEQWITTHFTSSITAQKIRWLSESLPPQVWSWEFLKEAQSPGHTFCSLDPSCFQVI